MEKSIGFITVLDLAIYRGAKPDSKNSFSMEEIEKTGLPFFGGCKDCGAQIACGNSYPTKNGWLYCESCCFHARNGYSSVEEANAGIFPPRGDTNSNDLKSCVLNEEANFVSCSGE